MKTALLFFAALFAGTIVSAQKLVIKGSDTLGAKLVPTLKEAYAAKFVEFTLSDAGQKIVEKLGMVPVR